MAMAFIDRLSRFCGGSRTLAWLATVNTALTILLLLLRLFDRSGTLTALSEHILLLPAPMSEALRHPWTFFTYMVTQYSPLHLLFNVLWLIWFGQILYLHTTDRRLLQIYVAGGIAGGLFFETAATFSPGSAMLCGSSASVLALMTAAAIRNPDYRLRLWLIGSVRLKWVAAATVILTFLGDGGNVAAHLGGVATGIIFGFSLRHPFAEKLRTRFFKTSHRLLHSRRTRSRTHATADALSGRLNDSERLDHLLDRIRISGYESLTPVERQELEAISRRLRKARL